MLPIIVSPFIERPSRAGEASEGTQCGIFSCRTRWRIFVCPAKCVRWTIQVNLTKDSCNNSSVSSSFPKWQQIFVGVCQYRRNQNPLCVFRILVVFRPAALAEDDTPSERLKELTKNDIQPTRGWTNLIDSQTESDVPHTFIRSCRFQVGVSTAQRAGFAFFQPSQMSSLLSKRHLKSPPVRAPFTPEMGSLRFFVYILPFFFPAASSSQIRRAFLLNSPKRDANSHAVRTSNSKLINISLDDDVRH